MTRRPLAPVILLAAIAALPVRAETRTIIDDLPGAGCLAAPATGQTLYVLDEPARTVTAVDPFAPDKRSVAVGPTDFDAGSPAPVHPVALACIDSNTLAVVCRTGDDWSLRAFRLSPATDGVSTPRLLQTLALGTARGGGGGDVFVNDSRDWLAVVGLPAPLPPVLRAPIAGARLGGFSDRLRPPVAAPDRLEAATASPFDEWVLFTRHDGDSDGHARLAFHSNSGRQMLLALDLELVGVRDAAFCRGSGTLWVVADGDGRDDRSAGLWRVDASLQAGRQAATAVPVADLPSPLSVVCLSERAVAISGGGPKRRVLLVNPAAGTEQAP